MPFGFPIAQVKRTRPSFDGGVVSQREIQVGALEVVEESDIFNRNCRLVAQSLQKVEPFWTRFKWGAVEDLQHTLDLSFGDQRHTKVADEILVRQGRAEQVAWLF